MDKYLSVITNFGCHGRCPYCIVRENGIKVPKSTVDGLDKLEDAITLTGANIVSISGGGDPLYRYSDNPLVPMYAIHPDIVTDEFLKGKLQECVDYIRDNYDMERFTEI